MHAGAGKHIVMSMLLLTCGAVSASSQPSRDTVLKAMKSAAKFMAEDVSFRGGYVYQYSADLSRQWGEIPARPTQIWTQPPGTPTVGILYLEAYRTTGDPLFLDYAECAADALIFGQHPAGGWHYLIDFDMPGIRKWYDEVASKCWGWEEYYHYYGNCTFDDQSTSEPTRFLLELYMTTLDPKYRVPLLKALGFILEAQYPNGGWPQRYPLMNDYPHDGHPDYTSYYTYNDGVISENIDILIDAWERLGSEEYREAAIRGMDFYLISQLPKPQAGWAQQYTMDMQPGAARTYEPAALNVQDSVSNMYDLMKFYTITGDKRYLKPIPDAIEWLEQSVINTDPSKNYTHTGFYEPGTNKPLYYHFEGTSPEDYRFWFDQDMTGAWWYRRTANPDIAKIRRDYERVSALTPRQAKAEYEAKKNAAGKVSRVDPEKVQTIISSLDTRGAWITDISIENFSSGGMLEVPPETIRGIDIQVFERNMSTLINYIKGMKK